MNPLSRLQRVLTTPWKRTLYIIFIAQLTTAVGFSTIFPFLPLYVEDLGASSGLSVELLAGLVFSAQAFTMMIASPFWGALADRYGRKLMVERAMFGGALIILLMAFVNSAEQLVVLRGVQGLITGTVAAANALVASQAPRDQTGYAMGLIQVGLGSGVALGPVIGGAIADQFGYSAAFYVTAALLLIAGLMVWLGVEEVVDSEKLQRAKRTRFLDQWRSILAAPGVLITYGLRFLTQLGRMMIVPIAPLFIQLLLPGSAQVNTFTGLVIGSASATTTLSSVYLGRLGDRSGHRRIVVACAMLAALLYFPQSLVTAGWQLLVLSALGGIALGGIIPAISALLARYTHAGEEGAVYGLDNSINAGARSIAPLLGSGVALWFNLRATFSAVALIFMLMGLIAAWLLPETGRASVEVYSTD